jgi:hypothetical protein
MDDVTARRHPQKPLKLELHCNIHSKFHGVPFITFEYLLLKNGKVESEVSIRFADNLEDQ